VPIYEYRCCDCGQESEVSRSLSDPFPPRCPACGGGDLARLISRVSVIKSERARLADPSWIDQNLARRLKKKANGELSPALEGTLDRMKSG
jgi:putative FmdB family regulatory protein